MNASQQMFVVATVLAGLGFWLRLPRARAWLGFLARRSAGVRPITIDRTLGTLLLIVSACILAAQVPSLGEWFVASTFWVIAGVTVAAAAATVTMRNPLYAAIWFAVMLLGTGALFLFQGAQFLGLATIVVYAGAILVTFLFLLMLANPKGQAFYDRLSWEAWISATAGAAMIGVLTISLTAAFTPATEAAEEGKSVVVSAGPVDEIGAARDDKILNPAHMAHLGGRLFSEYLLAIEAAGALLFAALVGATAIVSHERVSRSMVQHGESFAEGAAP